MSAEWRRALAADWPWARSLLRATDRVAGAFPKLDAGAASPAAYRIVWRDEAADLYVGCCPDGTGAIELTKADLVVYELDVAALAGRVAAAMGLASDFGEADGVPHAVRVGARDPLTDDEEWVYLVLQAGPAELADTLARLAVRHDRPFVLLTPTRAAWRPLPGGARSGARFVAMAEAFVVAGDGRWVAAAAGAVPPAGAGTELGLKVDEETFTVSFGGGRCTFGGRSKLLFALVARLGRRPGHRVWFDRLREKGDVWGDVAVEDTTIRGAVARLKRKLEDAGLADLSRGISTGSYQSRPYVILNVGDGGA